MEETYLTKALVLKREAYREFDGRVLVYSQDRGKLDLVARGMLRPGSKLAAHLEPITLINLMVIKGKNRDYVGSAIGLDSYARIKADVNRIYYVGLAWNLFNRLVHWEHEDQVLFALLVDFLDAISESVEPAGLYQIFSLRLIAILGYSPDLDQVSLSTSSVAVLRRILSSDSPFLEKIESEEELIEIIPKIVEYSVF